VLAQARPRRGLLARGAAAGRSAEGGQQPGCGCFRKTGRRGEPVRLLRALHPAHQRRPLQQQVAQGAAHVVGALLVRQQQRAQLPRGRQSQPGQRQQDVAADLRTRPRRTAPRGPPGRPRTGEHHFLAPVPGREKRCRSSWRRLDKRCDQGRHRQPAEEVRGLPQGPPRGWLRGPAADRVPAVALHGRVGSVNSIEGASRCGADRFPPSPATSAERSSRVTADPEEVRGRPDQARFHDARFPPGPPLDRTDYPIPRCSMEFQAHTSRSWCKQVSSRGGCSPACTPCRFPPFQACDLR
jgi:hypothetical protein